MGHALHRRRSDSDRQVDPLVQDPGREVALGNVDQHPGQESVPGADVILTIFGDIRQFSAKKLAFFSDTNVMITFFCKIAFCFESETPIFLLNFSAKMFKKS
jgi:hypothetical protein